MRILYMFLFFSVVFNSTMPVHSGVQKNIVSSVNASNVNYSVEKILGQRDVVETATNRITPSMSFKNGGVHIDKTSGHVYVFDWEIIGLWVSIVLVI